MKQVTHETTEQLQALQNRALVLKPNLPNVIATSMGWSQPRPNGTLELLVSFGGLDEILGLSADTQDSDDPIAVEIMSDLAIEDEDLPVPNTIASTILSTPAPKVDVADKTALEEFLAQSKIVEDEDETQEEVVETVKKKGGRPKKAAE